MSLQWFSITLPFNTHSWRRVSVVHAHVGPSAGGSRPLEADRTEDSARPGSPTSSMHLSKRMPPAQPEGTWRRRRLASGCRENRPGRQCWASFGYRTCQIHRTPQKLSSSPTKTIEASRCTGLTAAEDSRSVRRCVKRPRAQITRRMARRKAQSVFYTFASPISSSEGTSVRSDWRI